MTKTKEQLDEEKRVALSQRIVPLDISGMATEALLAKAKELHEKLYKLESEKYDLDDRFKRQQYDVSLSMLIFNSNNLLMQTRPKLNTITLSKEL